MKQRPLSARTSIIIARTRLTLYITYSGLETPTTGCPAPRKIIADTGAAVDLIGARDLQNKDKQRKTSEPIHFCTANCTTKADTIVQYFPSALSE